MGLGRLCFGAIALAGLQAVFVAVPSLYAGLKIAIEAGWYALVALALSAGGPRRVYLRAKTGLNRAAGAVMAALGVKLLASAWKD
jgi:threonine/homoserine/homoserine lactone efflux protein